MPSIDPHVAQCSLSHNPQAGTLALAGDANRLRARSAPTAASDLAVAMTGSPLVTIAVPTFNRATMLERCLESALGQSYAAVEVIVCDNASTDSTEDVVTRARPRHR